jgi:simple sugar transport system permease protein
VSIPLAIAAGAGVGAFWAFIPGLLKALTGAHEVVTTIMLNYIAASLLGYLVIGPLAAPGYSFARTGEIGSAALPIIFGRNLHAGVLIALVAVPLISWLLYRSTIGFEIRTVGSNPSAARYAGMRPRALIVMTMTLCGLLGGLAGTLEILGISHFVTTGYGTSVGFDSISVALLGRANPLGILISALLFGALRAGAGLMQIQNQLPGEIIDVIQALILLFLAAEVLIRRMLRIRGERVAVDELTTVTQSYGEGRVG